MKVKTLIKKLERLDPGSKVEFCTASGDSSGYVYNVSDGDGPRKKVVMLNCIGTHAFGEKLP